MSGPRRALSGRIRRRLANEARAFAWFVVQLLEIGPGMLAAPIARRLGRPTVTISPPRLGRLVIRTQDTDLETLVGVCVSGDYDISRYPQQQRLETTYRDILDRGETPVIIDAGANIGIAARWFLSLYPQAKIYAVEPEPQNAALCRQNLAAYPNAQVVEAAIGSAPGEVAMVAAGGGSWGWRTERALGAGVPVVTIPDLLAQAGPGHRLFVVKIDIEGFERDLFSGDTGWISDASALFVELHDWMLPGQGSSLPLQQALLGQGFEILALKETLAFVRHDGPPQGGDEADSLSQSRSRSPR